MAAKKFAIRLSTWLGGCVIVTLPFLAMTLQKVGA